MFNFKGTIRGALANLHMLDKVEDHVFEDKMELFLGSDNWSTGWYSYRVDLGVNENDFLDGYWLTRNDILVTDKKGSYLCILHSYCHEYEDDKPLPEKGCFCSSVYLKYEDFSRLNGWRSSIIDLIRLSWEKANPYIAGEDPLDIDVSTLEE